ncbi:PP2A regulatory subunit TAP46 [Iris pallida]|uniref:PP2A regulatory subunit TAP46 n=1 Tax=Iris pallida TaxID=29817 RepID=A0AAX6FCV5_IRIPA|nr:PP2A regulatory subunit TAP46 [Iris pallida]
MEEMSLPALFQQARQIHSAAAEDSSVGQSTLRKGIEALRRCDDMVSKLGLFSSNETKDDVSTANLKYLLVPFYVGELTEKLSQDDRLQVIKMSRDQLKEFISICEALELVPEEEIETPMQGGTDSAAARRAKKAWLNAISLAICKAFDLLEMLKKEEEMLLAVKEKSLQEGDDVLLVRYLMSVVRELKLGTGMLQVKHHS